MSNRIGKQPQQEFKQTGVCPFDKNHIIDPAKLLRHIKKCKSPTRRDFDECPFNPYHWVNFQELQQHKLVCPNRNSSFVDEYPRTLQNQSFQSHRNSNSFISDIHDPEITNDNMEMFKIAMDFEINKPAVNQISSFSKRINKEEMKQLNSDKLFKQPNFAEWYELHYNCGNVNTKKERMMHFFNDDD